MSEVRTPGPRKRLSADQKLAIVQESYFSGKQVAEIARKHNVGVSSLITWRQRANEGSLMGVKEDDLVVPASEVKKLKKEIQQLQRLLGKKTQQVELLQEAVRIGKEKKLLSPANLLKVSDLVDD